MKKGNAAVSKKRFGDIEVVITRKPIKNLYLRPSAGGTASVTAPLWATDEMIGEFVLKKAPVLKEWTSEKRNPGIGEFDVRHGGEIFVFGIPRKIGVFPKGEKGLDRPLAELTEKGVSVFADSDTEAMWAVEKLYAALLSEKLPAVLEKWKAVTGLSCSGVTVRKMVSRFGSCNTKTHRITVNSRLAYYPEYCLEYVVLHELSHILFPDHGAGFKAFVAEHMPDHKRADRVLKRGLPVEGDRRYMKVKIEAGSPADIEKRAPSERAVYRLFDSLGVEYRRIDHEPLFTIEECQSIDEMLGTELCKNLFLCDRGQNRFYLLLLPGEKRFVTKVFSPIAGDSRLAFAPEDKMREFLGLTPGSVSVLGLMNDTDGRVKLFIDREVLGEEYFACHPCVNTSSLVFRTEDLIEKILPAVGHGFTAVELP